MKRSVIMIVPLLLLFTNAVGVEAKGRSGPAKQSSFRSNCFGGQRNFSAVANNLGLSREEAVEFKNLAETGEPEFGYIESGMIFEKYLKGGRLTADYAYPVENGKVEMALVVRLGNGREIWSPVGSGEFGIPARAKQRAKKYVAPPIVAGSDNARGGEIQNEVQDMSSFGMEPFRAGREKEMSLTAQPERFSGMTPYQRSSRGPEGKEGKPFDPFDATVWGSYYVGESKARTNDYNEHGWSVGGKTRLWLHQDGPFRAGIFGTGSVGGSKNLGKGEWWKAGGGVSLGYRDYNKAIDDKLDLGVIYTDNDYNKFDYAERQDGLSFYASNYFKYDCRRRLGERFFPDAQFWLAGELPFHRFNHERWNPKKGKRLEDDPKNYGRVELTGKFGLYDFWLGEEENWRLTPQLVLGYLYEFQDRKDYGKIGLGFEGGYKRNTLFDFSGSFRKAFTSKGKSRFPLDLSLDLDGIRQSVEASRIKTPTKADYEARGSTERKAPPPLPFETKIKEETLTVDPDLRSDVARELDGTKMAAMVDTIASHDRETAALLVGVAKSESSFRHHYRNNYWGYARGRRGFKTQEEAVKVVGKKIEEYQSQGLDTPQKLVKMWKCGGSCATHPKQEVRNWINAAQGPYQRIAANL